MKTKHLLLLVAASGMLLGPRHLLAEDPPAPPPGEAPKPPPQDGGEHGRRRGDGDRHMPEHRGPQMKATPFIGVMTHSLQPEVRAQTGLAEGFGLLVEEVLPESPAKNAGLQQHDVLVLLDDQKLVNTEQLAALVRGSKKDSELVFTIKRAGTEQKVTIKVGEKMMPAMPYEGPSHWGSRSFGGFDGERFGQDLGKGIDRFQKGMREFQERMQDWSRGPRDKPAPQPPPFDSGKSRDEGNRRGPPPPDGDNGRGPNKIGPPPGDGPKGASSSASVHVDGAGNQVEVNSSSSSSFERNVTRKDKTGEYSLRQEGSEKIFTVKPVDGVEQTFPVSTEEQRKALPEALRDKLHELDEVSRRVKTENGTPPPPPNGRGNSI